MAQRPPGDPGQYQAPYGGMQPGMAPGQITGAGNPQITPQQQQQLQLQQQQLQLQQQQRMIQQQKAAAAAFAAGRLPQQGMMQAIPPGAVPLALPRPGQPLPAGPALQAALRQPMGPPGGPGGPTGAASMVGGGASAGAPGNSSQDGAASAGPVSSTIMNAEAYLSHSRYQPVQRRLMGGSSAAGADSQVLPRSQLDRLMRMQGLDQSFSLSPEVQTELVRIAEEFVTDVVERGCQLAAMRKAGALRAVDMAPYLERTHHIRVPGFGGEMRPYRRPNASEVHRERAAAVRHSAAMGGGGGGGAGGPIRGRGGRPE